MKTISKNVKYLPVANSDGGVCWSKLSAVLFGCLLFTVTLFSVSCKPKENVAKTKTADSVKPAKPQVTTEETDADEGETAESVVLGEIISKRPVFLEKPAEFKITKDDLKKFKASLSFETANKKPVAHQKYLQDKLKFKPVPNPNFDTEKSAVVGSFVCRFFPGAELKTQDDIKKLSKGIKVPFATLLPIYGEPVKAEAHEEEGYYGEIDFFKFEDNYNWFYRTKWNGKEGLVFGSDLTGLDFPADKNRLVSLQYLSKGASKEFYPIHQYNYLTKDVVDRLEKDKLAFQEVSSSEYHLFAEYPDDMIALYRQHSNGWAHNRDEPVFITTDLMAHARHLVFDRSLQYAEEFFFFPKVWELAQSFLIELEKVNSEDSSITANEETLKKAKQYFQVVNAICELAPTLTDNDEQYSRERKIYREEDSAEILKKYDKTVQEEIACINEAAGTFNSPLFSFADGSSTKHDYTQFKPRGHYTKNKVLAGYFKAMMLFGKANFLIAKSGETPLVQDGTTASGSEELTYNMEPIALLITELVKNNQDLYDKWADLFDPITDLIGISDDLSFKEILPLWKNYNVKDFKEWSSDKKNLLAFMEKAHKKLRPPAIADSSVFYTASESENGERKPPMGWRLFGQRFVFDSAVYHKVSSPRLFERTMISGLDIMRAFGSKTADELLENEYNNFPDLKNILQETKTEIEKSPEKNLSKTYYGTVLNEVALQAKFEKGAGFFFTESDAWNKKALLSAHGTWAELRHDTILYAKQDASECGGGGENSPTFRTEPIPTPVHYIEPNLAFWKNALVSTRLLEKTLCVYGLIDERTARDIKALAEICEDAIRIVKLEIADKEVSQKDIDIIARMPHSLSRVVLIGLSAFGSYVEEKDLQMALVADVFTDAETQRVLEIASGIPYRVYIPLNDKQGGKRIAVGYCFNYYEFTQPASDRLNDEQWKEKVYSKEKPDLEGLKPEWARNIALPPKQGK